MNTLEIAHQLVALCREGKFVDAVETLYGDGVVSVEAADYQGLGREMRGKEAVRRKNVEWLADNEVHGFTVAGPFLSPDQFAVWYSFDLTRKASGERVQFAEVAVYTVLDGQVVREEFLYAPGQ
ncbi:MAG: nuclear transport factor 2 family protein [Acidobacteria bacterium]|nr:nuclear transport factor 2 family protein [Acidobacteriota bacterium]